MARHVRYFQPLWFDRHFKKSLKSLSSSEQDRRLQGISGLIQALAECRHPLHGPDACLLAAQRLSRESHSLASLSTAAAFRYASSPARTNQPNPLDQPDGAVLMVAATLAHDHDRLQKLIAGRHGEILG